MKIGMRKASSFRTKLLIWVIPILVAGLLALSFSTYWYIRSIIKNELNASMLTSTGKSAETIENWLNTLLLEPETIAATPAAMRINEDFEALDRQNINRYHLLHEKYANQFLDVYAANRDGVYHTIRVDGSGQHEIFKGSIADREYFRSIMAGGPSQITAPLISRTFGVPTIFVVAPIRDEQGRPQGLIGAGISLDYVKRIAEGLTVGRGGYGFIIAKDGTFIPHPNRDFVMKKKVTDFKDPSVLALGQAMLAEGSGFLHYEYEGTQKIAFYQPIPRAGWSVATSLPTSEFFSPATRMLKFYALVTAIITMTIALLIVLASRRITNPLLEFAHHAGRIGQGEAQLAEVGIRSSDEIGTMASAFNGMVRRLNATLEVLSHSEKQYRTLVDNLSVGIYRSRPLPHCQFVQVNPAMLTIFQYDDMDEFLRLDLACLFKHPEQCADFMDQLKSKGTVQNMEIAMQRRDGNTIWCQVSTNVLSGPDGEAEWVDGLIEDISEPRRLEEQLRQSQKMEAIGKLAGGIAHDFNNLLTAIIGYVSLSMERIETGSPLQNYFNHIRDASNEAAKLTQGLLTISRKQIMTLKPIELNETVRKIEQLMTLIIGADVEFLVSCTPENLVVLGDSSQIEQVLMNLVTNARDAMPGGGRLSISTSLMEIQPDHGYLNLDPGKYALISISDTGHGMDDATRQRIFEPFFTTKEIGKGTGLGLSIVYGIIKQHNGEISVYSEPSLGTTFRIYMKYIDFQLDDPTSQEAVAPVTGNETILLAEDDEKVSSVYRAILEKAGFHVLDARNGLEAIEKFKQGQDLIKLLVFDLVMPKMNGKEALDEIRKLSPNIKIIFSSGYAQDIISSSSISGVSARFISKPASPTELLRLIRSVLDET
jgi:PAS domain S-box-containing protein